MNTIFEIAYDENGRLLVLAEDVQRWMLSESQSWALNAVNYPSYAVAYAHTSTILFGLQEQLNHVERVGGLDELFDDFSDDE
jgi:hypothetical protein